MSGLVKTVDTKVHRFGDLAVGDYFHLSRYFETYLLADLDVPGIKTHRKVSARTCKRVGEVGRGVRIGARARVWPR